MKMTLTRTPAGFAVHPDSADQAKKVKVGQEVLCEVVVPRNYQFFKKWWALITVMFDVWCETDRRAEYKGQPVMPELERFRKDVTILAGFYDPVFNIKGETRLEAKSISFANMEEDEFEKLYSATIQVGLSKIIPKGRYTEEELRATVEQIVGFA